MSIKSNISEHLMYDGKSGETYPVADNVGKSFDMTITDEIRDEYEKYQEQQKVFQNYVNEFNNYIMSQEMDLAAEFALDDCQLEEIVGETLIVLTMSVFLICDRE